VLLNKGDHAADFIVEQFLQNGRWRSALSGDVHNIGEGETLKTSVPAHGVDVLLLDAPVTRTDMQQRLNELMRNKSALPTQ